MLKKISTCLKAIYNFVDYLCEKLFWFCLKFLLAIILDVAMFCTFVYAGWYFFTLQGLEYRVQKVYHELLVKTGQSQEALPLVVIDEPIDNAYNDGTKVVIYTGLLNHMTSWDEVAMVLGHEIAHGNLWHLKMPLDKLKDEDIQVLEANADKLGAFYMIKAGYDVCQGRALFKYWKEENGDYLGGNHPNYAYRIDQLNLNCD